MALHLTKTGESTIINHNRQIMSRNLYPKRNSYIKERGTIIMTKIKNTKKGMAKKTLSMSLVVAMLATSNVPVWAAEFSDGTDVSVASEAEAPVAETADEFTDDAAATADTAEAPAVDDGTEADVATTSSLVYDDSKLEAFRLANAGTAKLDESGYVNAKNGEWGTEISLPYNSLVFKETQDLTDIVVYSYWMYKGNQISGSVESGKVDSWDDVWGMVTGTTVTPTKEQCIEGGSFSLRVQVLVNGDKNFDKVYDFGAARKMDVSAELADVNSLQYTKQVYNGKEHKADITTDDNNRLFSKETKWDDRNGHEITVNDDITVDDINWDFVRMVNGKNNLVDATAKIINDLDKDNESNGKVNVTAQVTKPGYTGSFTYKKAYEIEQKQITEAYGKTITAVPTPSEYEYTGEKIVPSTSQVTVKDSETGDDLSKCLLSVWRKEDAIAVNTKENPSYNFGLKFDVDAWGSVKNNYNYLSGTSANDKNAKYTSTSDFRIVKRDLTKCTVKYPEYSKGELDAIVRGDDKYTDSLTMGDKIEVYDANGNELDGLYDELQAKVTKAANGAFTLTVSPVTAKVNNYTGKKEINLSAPEISLRDYQAYLKGADGKADLTKPVSTETVSVAYTGKAYKLSKDDIVLYSAKETIPEANRALSSSLYDLEYDNRTDAGTGTIKVVGKGSYTGSTITLNYEIRKATVSNVTGAKEVVYSSKNDDPQAYVAAIKTVVNGINDATANKPSAAKENDKFTLEEGKDYTVKCKFVGDITDRDGIKNAVGNSVVTTVTVTSKNFKADASWAVGEIKDNVKKISDTTYEITSSIVKPSIGDKELGATVKVLNEGSYVFTGKEIIPDVEVTAKDGTVLKNSVDYRVDVKHGLHAGTAEVIITALDKDGKGLYKNGTTIENTTFEIKPANINNVYLTNNAITYTGKKIYLDGVNTPKVALKNDDKSVYNVTDLFESKTATSSYENNLNAGTASLVINVKDEWKNDFTASSAKVQFTIAPAVVLEEEIKDLLVYAENGHIINFTGFEGFQYDGTAKTFKDAEITIKSKLDGDNYSLVNGKDYTIAYANNVNPDQTGQDRKTAYIYAQLSGNFTIGKKDANGNRIADKDIAKVHTITLQDGTVIENVAASNNFRITKASVENAAVSVTNPVYDGGNKVAPTVKVTVDGKELTEGTDYVLTYEKDETYNATKENSKLVTVKGINGYVASSKTVKWGIDAKDIASDSVKVTLDKKSYKANEKPEVTVADGKTILDADEYSVAYTDMENGVLTITGEGKNYTGTKEVNYEVAARSDLADATVKGVEDVYVTGEQIKPEITVVYGKKILTEGTDYTVTYGENTAIGEGTVTITAVEGSVDYKGTQTVTFQIKDYDRADLADATIKGVDKAYYVTGEQIKPEITVISENEILKENEDYTVTYGENTEIGEGTVTITAVEGSKKFTGSQTVTFQIKDYDRADLADAVIEGLKDETVTGEQIKPEIRVVCGNKVLTEGTDYTVSYGENKEVGEGTVTITAVEGSKEYAGSKTVTFNIVEENPLVGAPVITNVEVSGNNAALILSGDVEGASGYDYVISASKDPSDKDARLDVVKNQVQTTANFKYVPQGTYYAYCHAWTRDENGKKVFGEWSNSYAFSVTAITPDTPEILSVKTKGSTITVTYKESANSTGYDVVLGKGSKKEHGETRPYQYGTYKKLNVKPGVCKAVFKNVPAGTYYAGVHSWNRTASENDNKVFSKWSNLETAKVK